MSAISKVEEELWNIFTYYTLHSDPTQPEQLKLSKFVTFAKDCQILSPTLTQAQINIVLTREARNKRVATYNESAAGYITFYDFINLLPLFAKLVYPDAPDDDTAFKRLLMENVLLLAGRRDPKSMKLDPSDEEANEVLKEKFGKSLLSIYMHYADISERRRQQEHANENKIKHKKLNTAVAQQEKFTPEMRALQKKLKNTLGYNEFFKLAHDFKLKSTALLTAFQIGDIYLTCVPHLAENRDLRVLNFDTFCTSLILMALTAHRESSASPANKVKTLLVFMWRAINSPDVTQRAVTDRYMSDVKSHAGSLNIFGSGLFSDSLLSMWQKDRYPNYLASAEKEDDSQQILERVAGYHSAVDANLSGISQRSQTESRKRELTKRKTGKSELYGYQIAELFLRKPELAELVYLEIQNNIEILEA